MEVFSLENQTFLQTGDKKRVADILNTIRKYSKRLCSSVPFVFVANLLNY